MSSETLQSVHPNPAKDGSYFYVADEEHTIVYQHQPEGPVPVLASKGTPDVPESIWAKTGHKKSKLRRLVLFCELKDCARRILDAQQTITDSEIADNECPPWADDQETLLDLYDLFFESFGPINKVQTQIRNYRNRSEPTVTRLRPNLRDFREDPDMPLVAALEIYNDETEEVELSEIFAERKILPDREIPTIHTAFDALKFSFGEKLYVDIEHIAALANMDPDQALAELQVENHIFHDPASNEWQIAALYLSGDINEKIKVARYATEQDPQYTTNIDALENVRPKSLKLEDIDISLGMHWIPEGFIHDFVQEISGDDTDAKVEYIPFNHFWSVTGTPSDTTKAEVAYGTEDHNALKLLQHCLNNTLAVVYKKDSNNEKYLDQNATLAAREKQDVIRERFQSWIRQNPEKAEELCQIYNDRFNTIVPPKLDGSWLRVSGFACDIQPYQHQLDAAWHNIVTGNLLYAHEVGAGKTFASILAAMKMKQLGKIKMPAFIVPNDLLGQFYRDFYRAFPNAHVNVMDEDLYRDGGQKMKARDRLKKFMARCKSYPWDAVIIPQSQFDEVKVSPQVRIQKQEEEVSACQAVLDQATSKIAQSHLRDLQTRRLQWLNIIKDTVAFEDEEEEVYIDESGIDYLFIDEGQHYKNKGLNTRIEGMATNGAARARRLEDKLYYLRQHYNSAQCLSIMTGTPIANSISELFVMQEYLQPQLLKALGYGCFDAWAANYTRVVNMVELAPEGGRYRMASHMAEYINVPELLRPLLLNSHFITTEELNIPKPRLKNGRHTVIATLASPALKEFIKNLGARADRVRNREVKSSDDNMLKITVEGQKAALGIGLEEEGSRTKLDDAADEIARVYHETKDKVYYDHNGNPDPISGSLQLGFCDFGTPPKKGNVYAVLKCKLIERGLPPQSIQFVQHFKTPAKQEDLKDQCRIGKVNVLIGTSENLGRGWNVQKRLVALHHLDAPYRPDFLVQRDGRGLRQGNQNEEIEIFRYATKGSFDIYKWQIVERKAGFIGQIMHGDLSIRRFDNKDTRTLQWAEVKAIASEDPILLEKVGVDNEVARLVRLKRYHEEEQRTISREIESLRKEIPIFKRRAKRLKETREAISQWPKNQPPISISGVSDHAPASERGSFLKDKLRQLVVQAKKKGDFVTEDIGTIYGFPAYATADPGIKRGVYTAPVTLSIADPNETEIDFWLKELEARHYERSKQAKGNKLAKNFAEVQVKAEQTEIETQSLDYLILQKILKPYQSLSDIWRNANDNHQVAEKKLTTYTTLQGQPFHHEAEYAEAYARQQEIHALLQERVSSVEMV